MHGSAISFALLFSALAGSLQAQAPLSLTEAVERCRTTHPLLAAEQERINAAQQSARQAGLRPNPTLILQFENYRAWGSPPFDFGRDTDDFAYLQAPIELGGKRARRVDVAGIDYERAVLERELLARQIIARVKRAYWEAAGNQRILDLLRETQKNFEQIVAYHEARVREGAMAEVDLIRVRLEAERLAVAANNAQLEAVRSRIQLLREMGEFAFPEVRLAELLDPAPGLPAAPQEAEYLAGRVESRLARLQISRAEARVNLEQAQKTPNLDALFGYKRSMGFNTVMGGVQIGLPVFNRNQGNIGAALAETRLFQSLRLATEAVIRAEVDAAWRGARLRQRQVEILDTSLRGNATQTYEIAQAAYREGGAELLRLLDAQRVRIETEVEYVRALAAYRQGLVDLEYALGMNP